MRKDAKSRKLKRSESVRRATSRQDSYGIRYGQATADNFSETTRRLKLPLPLKS